jgi:hopanoid biosynthesis associated RND transporter like protein HpnN
MDKIDGIFFQIPIRTFVTLLYAPESELKEIKDVVDQSDHLLNRLLKAPNLEGFLNRVAAYLEEALEEESLKGDPASFFKGGLGVVQAFVSELKSTAPDGGHLLMRWASLFFEKFEEADEEGFLIADQGKLHLMFIKPGDVSGDSEQAIELVRMVRAHIDALTQQYPNLAVGLTGQPALTKDEFEISERDMLWATLFALFTTALIFFLAFRKVAHPFYGFANLVIGVCLTFGLTTITIGHLNLISLSFAVILIGLGTQYGVHIIARYEEERGRGTAIPETVQTLMLQTVPSLFIGALTTAAAFYATMLIDFRGFRELAFIAGSGVLICFIIMSFGLPAFMVWHDRKRQYRPPRERPLAPRLKTHVSQLYVGSVTRFPRSFLSAAGLLSVLAVFAYFQWGPVPYFDYNLLNLQAKGTEAVRFEKRLLETHVSPRFAIYLAESPDEIKRIEEQLKALPTVDKVESLSTLLPEMTEDKVKTVRYIGSKLQDQLALGNRPSDPAQVMEALLRLKEVFGLAEEKLFAGGYVEALGYAGEMSASLKEASRYLMTLPEEDRIRRTNRLQEALGSEFSRLFKDESQRTAALEENFPTSLKERFLSPKGSYVLYAFPSVSIWNHDGLTAFVQDLRSVSDRFCGPPLQMYAVLSAMDSGWYRSALFAAIAIFLLFCFDFRSLRWALIATIPLACGLAWIYGGMALFDLQWNVCNLIALPLVLGIGADCGIHLIHRYREHQKKDVSFVLSSTGKAVTVAYSDTITSFFGLAIASHQGLASLGQVIIWGILCCYVAGMIVLPALLAAWPVSDPKMLSKSLSK